MAFTERTQVRMALLAGILLAWAAPCTYAQYSSPVRITNSKDQAVPVKDQDNPARLAVRLRFPFDFTGGPATATKTPYAVPAGKRLVVEYLSGTCEVNAGQTMYGYMRGNHVNLIYIDSSVKVFGGVSEVVISQPVKAYVDPADGDIDFVFLHSGPGASSGCEVILNGYLIDLP